MPNGLFFIRFVCPFLEKNREIVGLKTTIEKGLVLGILVTSIHMISDRV
jgi:hypothetical protein